MDQVITELTKQLENQFMAQGMILILFTGIMTALRNTPKAIYSWIHRKLFASVEIEFSSRAYHWMNKWLGTHVQESWFNRAFTGKHSVTKIHGRSELLTILVPMVGTRLFFHNKKPFWVHRSRTQKDTVSVSNPDGYIESFTLYAFKLSHINGLVEESMRENLGKEIPGFMVWTYSGGSWACKKKQERTLDSVILAENVKMALVKDVENFDGKKEWYNERGLQYGRGYALAGPPGSGKTSLVTALASKFRKTVWCIDLSSMHASGVSSVLWDHCGEGDIVLFEDIDAVYRGREYLPDNPGGMEFNTFLNVIDGIATTPGLIKIFTTNHVERLDPALLRPGRCDKIFHFGNATESMASELYLKFFPEEPVHSESFAKKGAGKSMCFLQEHLLTSSSGERACASLGAETLPMPLTDPQPEMAHEPVKHQS